MKRIYFKRVPFFAIRPRVRFLKNTIELVWLGAHATYVRVGGEPIFLSLAGKKIWGRGDPDEYKPEGYVGGSTFDYIPKGNYCYEYKEWDTSGEFAKPVPDSMYVCPFWDTDLARPEQMSGYCHFMHDGDWSGTMLLWDSCKECGENLDDDEEEVEELGEASSR